MTSTTVSMCMVLEISFKKGGFGSTPFLALDKEGERFLEEYIDGDGAELAEEREFQDFAVEAWTEDYNIFKASREE